MEDPTVTATHQPAPAAFAPVSTAPATPAVKPDGPKEYFENVRWLIGELRQGANPNTTEKLDRIVGYLDLLEEKPEAVAAEKARLAKIAEDDKAKAEAAAKAKAEARAEAAKVAAREKAEAAEFAAAVKKAEAEEKV